MVYLAIEYNWNKVGGIFSSVETATAWCERIMNEEPNLMWEVHPFELDVAISDKEAMADWRDR